MKRNIWKYCFIVLAMGKMLIIANKFDVHANSNQITNDTEIKYTQGEYYGIISSYDEKQDD